ncbi:hypothetical protein [Thermotomaculum hydrothermale]|nr:hypothetical protein [Thermotomaculum hydrothermale]
MNFPVLLFDSKTGRLIAKTKTNIFSKYKFKNIPVGVYVVKVGKFTKEVSVSTKNIKLDFNLSAPDGLMHHSDRFVYNAAKEIEEQTKGKDPGKNNQELMNWIAGEYYSYQGNTERKLMLCPNGVFYDSSESSYSGTMSDAGGNQTGAWGSGSADSGNGRWAIRGNKQSGTITFCYKGKDCNTVKYYAMKDNCFKINGITFCYKGKPRCR